MGQVLQPDNIPNRTIDSPTQVSIAETAFGQPTRITIGGQQYKLDVAVSCDLTTNGVGGLDTGSLVVDTTYYIYAVLNGSSVDLVCSTSSVGPTGFSTYTPVGSFATDGSANASNIEIFEAGASYQGPVSTTGDITADDISASTVVTTGSVTAGAHIEGPSIGYGADTTWNSDGFDVTDISFMDVDGTSRTITGFTGGVVGQEINIVNQSGSGFYRFQNNTGAFNRLALPSSDIYLAPSESISFIRRGSLWHMSHKTTKHEIFEVNPTASSTTAGAALVQQDATNMPTITLSPGWWNIGYNVIGRVFASTTGSNYGSVWITNSSNVAVPNSTRSVGHTVTNEASHFSCSAENKISVSSSTTYKLRIMSYRGDPDIDYFQIPISTAGGMLSDCTFFARRVD